MEINLNSVNYSISFFNNPLYKNIIPFLRLFLTIKLILIACISSAQTYTINRQEFVGPFPSWVNIKTKYGAKGDGISDDTQALQKALNEIGTLGENESQVLFLPAGTYKITSGLTMSARMSISIIGESAVNTKIKWSGSNGGTMLFLNGVSYSRFSRITWDGSGKANTAIAHKWDGSTGWAVTHMEHSDETFIDVGHGLRGGRPHLMDAETSVLRCRFIRNFIAGVSIESFNALDWFIWDSYFEDCRVGVTNDPPTGGAGNFHVYNSIFKRSTYADITMRNTMYFSVRNNYSIHSKAFFISEPIGQNGGGITLQKNTILDPLDSTPIYIHSKGPTSLLDNVIRSREGQTGPVVISYGDLLTVGNTFTINNPVSGSEKVITIDDLIKGRSTINPVEPSLQGTPVKKTRKIFNLLPGRVDDTFQKTIDSAAALAGQRPVIHLRPGAYSVTKTIIIPAGSDLQIIGDGFDSRISWFGPAGGDVLRLEGADKVTLEEFSIYGNYNQRGIGLTIKHSDQAGKLIFMEGVNVWDGKDNGVLMEGFRNINTELHNFNHAGNTTSLKVSGGSNTGGKLTIFGGASSNNTISYDVVNGGNLMAQDIWYEGSPKTFVNLSGSGNFTLNGANIYASSSPDSPVILDNFNGKATFLGVNMNGKFVVKGTGNNTSALAMGIQFNTANSYTKTSANAKAVMLNSRIYNQGSYSLANIGTADPVFIKAMLQQVRADLPQYKTLNEGIILHRLQVAQTQTGIRILPATAVVNQKPVVNINSPANNTSYVLPASIPITANASDADGAISKVEFYQGNIKLGEDISTPYTFTWNTVSAGNYTLTAKAIDNKGNFTTSSSISVQVMNSTQGLTAYWPLDELSGTIVVDASGNGYNGTLINNPTWSSGKIKGALEGKDLQGRYIQVPGLKWKPASFSVAWWLYPYSLGTSRQQLLASKGWGAFMFHTNSNGEAFVGTDLASRMNATNLPAGTVQINQWQHFVFTYEAGVGKFYKNGKLLSTKTGMLAPVAWEGFKIGNSNINTSIHGKIDDIRIYNRAISLHEVITLSTSTNTLCSASGSILKEVWTNTNGTTVNAIPVNATPNLVNQLALFESSTNFGSNYAQRLRGYICAPQSGNYTFWIASDDNAELWLSPDTDPAKKVKIASVSNYTGVREWSKYSSQKSAGITLQAGKSYYIEALHKEGGGSDNLAVGWQLPDGTLERPIAGTRLSPFTHANTRIASPHLEADYTPAFTIYPNPTSTRKVVVEATGLHTKEVTIIIYNTLGAVNLTHSERVQSSGVMYKELILNNFSPGIYTIHIQNGDHSVIKKLSLIN